MFNTPRFTDRKARRDAVRSNTIEMVHAYFQSVERDRDLDDVTLRLITDHVNQLNPDELLPMSYWADYVSRLVFDAREYREELNQR